MRLRAPALRLARSASPFSEFTQDERGPHANSVPADALEGHECAGRVRQAIGGLEGPATILYRAAVSGSVDSTHVGPGPDVCRGGIFSASDKAEDFHLSRL